MKHHILPFLAASALALTSLLGCNQKPKEFSLSDYLIGNDYYIDTVCIVDGNAFCMLGNPDYGYNMLYDRDGIIAFNPLLSIDSIDGTTYNVSSFLKEMDVDFADTASVAALRAQYPLHPDFKLICKGFENNATQTATYGMSVEEATSKVSHHKELNAWIQLNLGDTVAAKDENITADSIVRRKADAFFANIDEMYDKDMTQFTYSSSESFLIYEQTCAFITFMDYSYEYAGGPHGIYNVTLKTFSLTDACPVDQDYLFKAGTKDAIDMLVYQAMADDSTFADAHGCHTAAEAKAYLNDYLAKNLPCPAVTSQGIMYCFQPYEIGSYSEGEYDFLLPFDKINQCLTPKGLALAGK